MKKLLVILCVIVLKSCAPTTMITGTWKSKSYQGKAYDSLLVVALTSQAVIKSTVENDLSAALERNGVRASKSIDLFPPNLSNSDTDKQLIMQKVQGSGVDAILTISLLSEEASSRYMPGRGYYDPFNDFYYYRNFWGYYSYWYPYYYGPYYYNDYHYYFMEANLYDSRTDELVWSAQSKTYYPPTLDSFSKDFAKTISDKLRDDGLLAAPAVITRQ